MTKRKDILILLILIFICLALVIVGIVAQRQQLVSSVQKPTVTHGEFPFKLVYRVDNEIITVEDTYICEYRGTGWNWNIGGHRKWRGYIKGTGQENVHVLTDGEHHVEVIVPGVQYYMGLSAYSNQPYTPKFHYVGPYIGDQELFLRNYDIEIISFEHAPSIQALPTKDDALDIVN